VGAVHSPHYVAKIREGTLSPMDQMVLELPFSPELREASLLCCGGTLQVAESALDQGVATHLGGGFHHAFRDHGEGFCLLNDVAVALRSLLDRGLVQSAAVVDLDVHQGNGTASIFASEPRVFTFSMHQEANYPFPKPPSDLDLGLPNGLRDEPYLEALREGLARVMTEQRPELVIYLAGADPFVEDQLGGLALTKDGLMARDRMVLERCRGAGAAVGVVLAGGYARREADTVAIHRNTIEATMQAWERDRDGRS
jgi:acetoin utilization deacetylase AcuC-like enzyme